MIRYLPAKAGPEELIPPRAGPPPCFNWRLCRRRAELEKGGRSVCRPCAAKMRGQDYPLRQASGEPLYPSGRHAAHALDMIEVRSLGTKPVVRYSSIRLGSRTLPRARRGPRSSHGKSKRQPHLPLHLRPLRRGKYCKAARAAALTDHCEICGHELVRLVAPRIRKPEDWLKEPHKPHLGEVDHIIPSSTSSIPPLVESATLTPAST